MKRSGCDFVITYVLTLFPSAASVSPMATKSEHLQIRLTPEQKATLRRKAQRAGQDVSSYVLSRVVPDAGTTFGALVRAAGEEADRKFALAELNELLAGLPPALLNEATSGTDLSDLSPLLQNTIAAMVEQAAHQKGVAPPAWVTEITPLAEPHFAVPYSSLRLHLLRAAPVPFKRRNIFVDSTVGDRV